MNASPSHTSITGLRRAVAIVGLANLAYFFVEFGAAINFLIFGALGWSLRNRARIGMVLAGVLLIPALALFWTAWQEFNAPTPPDPWLLSITGLGALTINVSCAFLLVKFRHHSGSLSRAAFLSARNDAFAKKK